MTKQRKSQRSSTHRRDNATHPPQLRTNIEVKHQYRFSLSGSAGSYAISDTLLLQAAGVCAKTTTSGAPIFQAVKLDKVEVWGNMGSALTSATCSVLYPASGVNPMPREDSDVTVSASFPAHVISVPPRNTLSGFWNTGTNVTIFTVTVPAQGIVDVWLSLVLNDGGSPVASATLAGASVGSVYFQPLDSSTLAGANLTPVGLQAH
jgi:hypothetical protein